MAFNFSTSGGFGSTQSTTSNGIHPPQPLSFGGFVTSTQPTVSSAFSGGFGSTQSTTSNEFGGFGGTATQPVTTGFGGFGTSTQPTNTFGNTGGNTFGTTTGGTSAYNSQRLLVEKNKLLEDSNIACKQEIECYKNEIETLKSQIEQVNLQLDALQSVPPEKALEAAIDTYEGLRYKRQLQEEETSQSLAILNSLFENLQIAQSLIVDNVQSNNVDEKLIDDRDECIDNVRCALKKTIALLNQEREQQENQSDRNTLLKKVEQWLKTENEQAVKCEERTHMLQSQQKHITDNIGTYINRFDTKRTEIEQKVHQLKKAESDLGTYTKEVRILKNRIDDTNEQGTTDALLTKQLEQLKSKRNQASVLIEQLKKELVQKSREEGSLPEYELKVGTIKSTKKVVSPNAELMIKDYTVEHELTGGAQAKVYLCRSKKNEHVVIKVYQVYSMNDAETGIKEVCYSFITTNNLVSLCTIAQSQKRCQSVGFFLIESH
jgi:hypothetical protein